jgi:hypothetical protein
MVFYAVVGGDKKARPLDAKIIRRAKSSSARKSFLPKEGKMGLFDSIVDAVLGGGTGSSNTNFSAARDIEVWRLGNGKLVPHQSGQELKTGDVVRVINEGVREVIGRQ